MALFSTLLASMLAATAAAAAQQKQQPNFIVIETDDQVSDCVGGVSQAKAQAALAGNTA